MQTRHFRSELLSEVRKSHPAIIEEVIKSFAVLFPDSDFLAEPKQLLAKGGPRRSSFKF